MSGVVNIETYKQDKYGRYLAKLYNEAGCLNDILISEGHAVPYFGGAK